MAGKPSLKSELIDEILEAVCFYQNFQEEVVDKIVEDIDANEAGDHENDKTRAEVIGHFLKALESFSAKAYEDVDRHVHAAIQRLHNQELQDFKDDKPRNDARIHLALSRQKAFHNQEILQKLVVKLQQHKKVEA